MLCVAERQTGVQPLSTYRGLGGRITVHDGGAGRGPLPRVRYGFQSADAEMDVTRFKNSELVLPLIETLLIVP